MKRRNLPKRPLIIAFNSDGNLTGMCSDWSWTDLARLFGNGRSKPLAGFEVTQNGITVHFNDIQTVGESIDYREKLMS